MLPPSVVADDEAVEAWVARAIAFTASLPPKEKADAEGPAGGRPAGPPRDARPQLADRGMMTRSASGRMSATKDPRPSTSPSTSMTSGGADETAT